MWRSACCVLPLAALASACVMSQVQFIDSAEGLKRPGTQVTVTEPTGDRTLGHIYANSWGIYVFAKLPYLAGGIDEDGQPVWRYFEDAVKVDTVVGLIRAEALRRGATHLVDLKSDWISEWSAPLVIFWIVETQASAGAIRVTGEAPPGAISLGDPDD